MLTVKYLWYAWKELTKKKRYEDIKSCSLAKLELKNQIKKDWWLEFTYDIWKVKELFVCESQIQHIIITSIEISEKVINVKQLLLR